MVVAYVMVKAHTSEADRLKESIEALDGVLDAHIVAGDIDLIAKVEVDSPAAVKDVAATRIQAIDGVEDTQTYIAMD
ncbi:Lrp/AsnC family transcriptional regulator [Halapricum sp. CBA1109]|uniref:Lrp/AsnC family transcriptional regulator n=1 Tax=Halapricum sp. CBA1109 TaxID=2668068 RepID=UPI0012FA1D54|nr:Lrp/AsnC ligand binding domain-containing protein [Halapricum sp. CBA1109]MUV90250.1 Lrp/AsnC family transcriptional regulator [Halapricum sp. CBA1109]